MIKTNEAPPAGDPTTYTVRSFCQAHNISRTHLYNLWSEGRGPRHMRAGRRILIAGEAAADWRRRLMEEESRASDPLNSTAQAAAG